MGERVEQGIGIISKAKEREQCVVQTALDQVFEMMGYPKAWFESEKNKARVSKHQTKNEQKKHDDGRLTVDVETIWSIDGEALFKTVTHRILKYKEDYYDVTIKIYDINEGTEIEIKEK